MRPCCIAHAHACDYFNPSRVCGHSFSFKRVLPYRQAVIVLVSRHCNRPNWHDSSYRRIGLIAIVFCALVVWANNTRMTFYTQVIGSILCLKWEQEHIPFLGVRLLWRQSSIANCFEGPVHLFNWSATVYVPWLKQGLRLAQYIPQTQNLYNMYAYIYIYICMKDWRYMYVFVCMYVFMPVCIYVCDCIVLSGGHIGRFLLRRDASWNVGAWLCPAAAVSAAAASEAGGGILYTWTLTVFWLSACSGTQKGGIQRRSGEFVRLTVCVLLLFLSMYVLRSSDNDAVIYMRPNSSLGRNLEVSFTLPVSSQSLHPCLPACLCKCLPISLFLSVAVSLPVSLFLSNILI